MKALMLVAVSAVLGVALCALGATVLNASWFGVRFPAPGGEDDFSSRAAAFMFIVCPVFALMGGWLGGLAARTWRQSLAAWAGAGLGAMFAFLVLFCVRDAVSSLIEPGAATRALLGFFGAWIALAGIGAALGRWFAGRR